MGLLELPAIDQLNINGGTAPIEYWEALADAINARNAAVNTPGFEDCVWLVNSLWLAIMEY